MDNSEVVPLDSSPRDSWSKTLKEFQHQVESLLGSVDKEKARTMSKFFFA